MLLIAEHADWVFGKVEHVRIVEVMQNGGLRRHERSLGPLLSSLGIGFSELGCSYLDPGDSSVDGAEELGVCFLLAGQASCKLLQGKAIEHPVALISGQVSITIRNGMLDEE